MKIMKYSNGTGTRSLGYSPLGSRHKQSSDSVNKSDYCSRRFKDLPAIEAHIRGCKLPITRIASMYGYSVESIEQIEKDIWIKDAVYRLNKVSYT